MEESIANLRDFFPQYKIVSDRLLTDSSYDDFDFRQFQKNEPKRMKLNGEIVIFGSFKYCLSRWGGDRCNILTLPVDSISSSWIKLYAADYEHLCY